MSHPSFPSAATRPTPPPTSGSPLDPNPPGPIPLISAAAQPQQSRSLPCSLDKQEPESSPLLFPASAPPSAWLEATPSSNQEHELLLRHPAAEDPNPGVRVAKYLDQPELLPASRARAPELLWSRTSSLTSTATSPASSPPLTRRLAPCLLLPSSSSASPLSNPSLSQILRRHGCQPLHRLCIERRSTPR